jgi:hypothetical protein
MRPVPSTYWRLRLYPAWKVVWYFCHTPLLRPLSFTQTLPLPAAL